MTITPPHPLIFTRDLHFCNLHAKSSPRVNFQLNPSTLIFLPPTCCLRCTHPYLGKLFCIFEIYTLGSSLLPSFIEFWSLLIFTTHWVHPPPFWYFWYLYRPGITCVNFQLDWTILKFSMTSQSLIPSHPHITEFVDPRSKTKQLTRQQKEIELTRLIKVSNN